MSIRNEVIWLTGASTGLGQALFQQLVGRGNTLIITARNSVALTELATRHDNVIPMSMDIAGEQSATQMRNELETLTPYLDRVILNAGACEYLDPAKPDWMLMEKIAKVNYFGMVNCVAASMELLKKARSPHLVGISSQVVHAAFPRTEAYGASKAAADYFLRSLWLDMAQFGIDVTIIQPGFIDTPLTQRNDFAMPFLMPADQAASRCIKAIEKRRRCYVFPKRLLLLLKLLNACPPLQRKLLASSERSATASGGQP